MVVEQADQPHRRGAPVIGGRPSHDPLVDQLQERVEVLEAAMAVNVAVSLDLDGLLTRVCQQTAASLSCQRAAVYLRDETLRLAHLHATGDRSWRGDGHEAARELARRAPVAIMDVSRVQHLDGPWSAEHGAVSVLALPLSGGGGDLGLLVAARTGAADSFTEHDQRVGAAIARQASPAIANAQRHERERAMVARLEERERVRADHVTGLVHDLRTPLTGLMGLVRTLQVPGAALTPAERAVQLDTIARQGDRLAGMIDDILLAARSESGALAPDAVTTVALGELLTSALEIYDAERRARLRPRIQEQVVVRGDPHQLLRVVQNLLDNALRYSPPGELVDVRVAREGGVALLEVCDRGQGIPAEQMPRLFHRFAPGRHRAGSTGFGLYVVREIVVGHGGTVRVTSPEDGGATVVVRLPAVP